MVNSEAHLTSDCPQERHLTLRDERRVRCRPIEPSDAAALVALHERMSADSRYLRFFTCHRHLQPEEVEHWTGVDYDKRYGLVALDGDQLIARACYEGEKGQVSADVAFYVDDTYHGQGIATQLLYGLAAAARRHGIRRFTATTMWRNAKMLAVFRDAGYPKRTRRDGALLSIDLDIADAPSPSFEQGPASS